MKAETHGIAADSMKAEWLGVGRRRVKGKQGQQTSEEGRRFAPITATAKRIAAFTARKEALRFLSEREVAKVRIADEDKQQYKGRRTT